MQIVHRLPSRGLLGQWCWAAAIAWLSHRPEHDNLHAAATTERNAASPVTVCHPSQRHPPAPETHRDRGEQSAGVRSRPGSPPWGGRGPAAAA